MLVDDEEGIRNSSGNFLKDQGYGVCVYPDGQEALEAFIKDPDQFDLIISDVTMPGLTGDRLAERVLEIRPELPIILCSGYSDRLSEHKRPIPGIYKFLDKPVSLKNLALIIREKLDEISRSKALL